MEESKDKENNNQTIDNRVRKRYQQLIEEGSLEIGVCPFIDPNVPPEWFDESKFKRAQKTADKYLIRLVKINCYKCKQIICQGKDFLCYSQLFQSCGCKHFQFFVY